MRQTQHGSVSSSVAQESSVLAANEPTPPQGSSVLDLGGRAGTHGRDDVERQTAFETGVLPLLGVDDDASKASRGSAANRRPETAASDNRDIIRLFEAYRTRVHPFHYITYDLDVVEEKLCRYLCPTAGENELPDDSHFLCLLYAILASEAQFCD